MQHTPLYLLVLISLLFGCALQAQNDLDLARFNRNNELVFPPATDEWIHLGTSLGGDYGEGPFDPANPGALGVVQMEPEAYRYFLENGEYADGSMFLLSFYHSEAESSPKLPGFVQGDLYAQEIHMIDKTRFDEGRGFFLYPADATAGSTSSKVPDGSACVECHEAEGDFDGTFTQFYPRLRARVAELPAR